MSIEKRYVLTVAWFAFCFLLSLGSQWWGYRMGRRDERIRFRKLALSMDPWKVYNAACADEDGDDN